MPAPSSASASATSRGASSASGADVLEAIDLDAISARGYGFQIETTYRVLRKGFSVVEIPITFVDRRVGESKMGGSIVVEAMLQVPVLRVRALRGHV